MLFQQKSKDIQEIFPFSPHPESRHVRPSLETMLLVFTRLSAPVMVDIWLWGALVKVGQGLQT